MRIKQILFIIIAASILLTWTLYSDFKDNPSQSNIGKPTTASQIPAGTLPKESSYALQTGLNTWPETIQDDSAPVTRLEALLTTNYYVVLDASGSMNETECSGNTNKMQAALQALASFAQSVPADANFGLAVFNNSRVQEHIPLSRGNQDRLSGLRQPIQPSGSTPLKSSIAMAYERLTQQGRRQLGYGEYHLVVITDGKATSGQDPSTLVRKIFNESPVMLHTIGFCIGTAHSLNRPGRSFYRAADNPDALRRGLSDVLAEAPAFDVTQFHQ